MEAMTEAAGDQLVQEVETAKELFPDARVKVRRGHLILFKEDLIIFEPLVWALQHEQTEPS